MKGIRPQLVGIESKPIAHQIDARWLMAYAAGIGETDALYLDTLREGGIVPHPLFASAYEWPALAAIIAGTVPEEVITRGVHATHDLEIHRLPMVGEQVITKAQAIAMEARKPGAYVVTRILTIDANGEPVTTTDVGTIYLGVELEGPDRRAADYEIPPSQSGRALWEEPLTIPVEAAHVYTECARIWNPIHTDRAVAKAAGLPDRILHGTATLARVISAVVRREAGGDPRRVRRLYARFGAMVLMPSTLTIQGLGRGRTVGGETMVGFQVLTDNGGPAIRDGVVMLGA